MFRRYIPRHGGKQVHCEKEIVQTGQGDRLPTTQISMVTEKRTRKKKDSSSLSARERFCLDAYLLNEDADLCYQLATGRTDEDCRVENFHKMALRYVRLPHVAEYLTTKKTELHGRKDSARENSRGSYRTKEEVLDALIAELPYVTGKDRADLLMKIADLQRMKQEENIAEDNTVHFYVPVTCHMCDLYNKEKERKEGERRKSLDCFDV